MKNALAVSLVIALAPIAGATYAQTEGAPVTGISVTTDPARAAEVERKAQEIAERQQQTTSGTSGTSGTSAGPDQATTPKKQKEHGKAHKGSAGSYPEGGTSGRQ